MSKLREELAHLSTLTLAQLPQVPYLQAISLEANRLSFGLTGRQPHINPDGPLLCKAAGKYFVIPTGTQVSASTLLVHTNPDIFPNPWKFDLERWLSSGGRDLSRYMLAYSKGPRICIGMNLANAELAMSIAEMSKWDTRLFEAAEADVKFLHDYHVSIPRLNSLGIRVKALGRWSMDVLA